VFNFAILTGVPPVSHVSCAVVLRHITLNFAYKQNSFGAACFCIFFIFFLYLPQRVASAFLGLYVCCAADNKKPKNNNRQQAQQTEKPVQPKT